MMSKYFKSTILILLVAASLASCEREEPVSVGGKGGNATLNVTPQHHSKNIDSCMVYIKYNTLDKPTSAYDDSAKCVIVNGKPVASFSGLKKGNYYLFGFGWDPAIVMNVKGGAPKQITEETVISYNLAVTED
jgi:hypothetical protein